MAKENEHVVLELCGHDVRISNPAKVFFPERGVTKMDLVDYYVTCEQEVVRHLRERPTVMKRWVDGVAGKPFFQKRVPDGAPEWLQTATVTFPSGRHARELVPNDAAHLAWGVNLGVVDWNPWPVRRADLDHPDELRVDLDPCPRFRSRRSARSRSACARSSTSIGLLGFPKTSGSRGIHVYVRIEPRHSFEEVRRAALALAREVERRMPGQGDEPLVEGGTRGRLHRLQPERARPHGRLGVLGAGCARRACLVPARVGARSRTSIRRELRLRHRAGTPARARRPLGDDRRAARRASMSLLELAARDEREGLGDAPWPPHFSKQKGEPPRVQPSRARVRTNARGKAAR